MLAQPYHSCPQWHAAHRAAQAGSLAKAGEVSSAEVSSAQVFTASAALSITSSSSTSQAASLGYEKS